MEAPREAVHAGQRSWGDKCVPKQRDCVKTIDSNRVIETETIEGEFYKEKWWCATKVQ